MKSLSPLTFKQNIRHFLAKSETQRVVEHATNITLEKREAVLASVKDWERLRDQARQIKQYALQNLPDLLETFEQQVIRHGGSVFWADDGEEARSYIAGLAKDRNAKIIVKGKSILSEEIHLGEHLQQAGHEVWETDLGELIVQLEGAPPSHITAPALHLSRFAIGKLFQEKLGEPYSDDPIVLTAMARKHLRQKFLHADLGIIGANFIVAETGTVVSLENEGNIRMSSNLPDIVVCVVGIEKVIPRLENLYPLLTLLPANGTGQRSTAYVSLLSGPRTETEKIGPREFHVVLVDNGRTRILADEVFRTALTCIRCGACMNICPVFRRVSGHAYGSVNPGPIGSILTPLLLGLDQALDLPFGSSLCGACADICPVQIPLPDLLLELRKRIVEQHSRGFVERLAMALMAVIWRKPKIYSLGARFAPLLWLYGREALEHNLLEPWLGLRELRSPGKTGFRQLWKQHLKDRKNDGRP